jgi:hypothetical protein
MTRSALFLVASLVGVAGINGWAGASPLDGLPGLSIIKNLRDAANNVVDNASAKANGLAITLADRANIMAENANIMLGGRASELYDKMEKDEKIAMTQLYGLQLQLEGFKYSAYDIRDTTVVDVSDLVSVIPFTKVPDFYMQSIRDIAYIQHPGDYKITVTARGIGSSSDLSTSFALAIDGNTVQLSRVNITTNGQAEIFIPNEALSGKFNTSSLVPVSATLSVTVKRHHFLGDRSNTYTVPFWFTLYPKKAASVTLQAQYPTYGWVSAKPDFKTSQTQTTPNRNGCHQSALNDCAAHTDFELTVTGLTSGPPKPDAQRVHDCRMECTSAVPECADNAYAPNDYEENYTKWKTTLLTWSTPTTWRANCKVDEYQKTGTATDTSIIDVNYDEQPQVTVEKDTTLLTGIVTLFTGQRYTMQIGAGVDRIGTIRQVSDVDGPPGKRIITIEAARPIGVQ